MEKKKIKLGQFFTKASLWLKPQIVEFIKNSNCSIAYDPYAGGGDLLKAAKEILSFKTVKGLDIDESLNWEINDSLKSIPHIENAVIITNPPYLSNYSASRKKIYDSVGRWLNGKGLSMDIIPMRKNVLKQNFLTFEKAKLPSNIKTVVGNLPFSLMDDFVRKALELTEDCYFLVNGDTVMTHFPENVEHIYIFSGLEGNQKDYRSRCEFDVPYLIKSALWCCIVHITRKKQKRWVIERNLSNDERRDGYHIALGKNTFVKLDKLVEEDERVTQIPVKSSIIWKGGKKIITSSGIIDGKTFKFLEEKE